MIFCVRRGVISRMRTLINRHRRSFLPTVHFVACPALYRFPSVPSSVLCSLGLSLPFPPLAFLSSHSSVSIPTLQHPTSHTYPGPRFPSSSSASSADGVRATHTSGLGFRQGQAGLTPGFGLGGSVDHTQTQSCLQA